MKKYIGILTGLTPVFPLFPVMDGVRGECCTELSSVPIGLPYWLP